jgi:hypothetical protein
VRWRLLASFPMAWAIVQRQGRHEPPVPCSGAFSRRERLVLFLALRAASEHQTSAISNHFTTFHACTVPRMHCSTHVLFRAVRQEASLLAKWGGERNGWAPILPLHP